MSVPKLPDVFNHYKPNISFCIDSDHYLVKTAETEKELLGAFQLRNDVFYKEWTNQSAAQGLDIDKMDVVADHLIIVKKDVQQVVGTYRLISSKFSSCFYTQKFFEIDDVLKSKSHYKVEMGRACTDMSLRNSKAIHYMWLGLARYFRETLSRYMFGCASVIKVQKEDVINIYNYLLKKNYVDKSLNVIPKRKYQMSLSTANEHKHVRGKLPRLFLWYLSLGAKVGGPPCFDPGFGSYDFFIILDFKHIDKAPLVNNYEDAVYLKRYLNR